MSAKTKIIVLHKKEVIYAGTLTLIGIFFVLLFLVLFLPDSRKNEPSDATRTQGVTAAPTQTPPSSKAVVSSDTEILNQAGVLQENLPVINYVPGIYKTELILGGQSVEVEAILEKDHIENLRLVNLDEAVATMYPLLQPTMDDICKQVYESQSIEGVKLDNSAKYTSLVLLEAIRCCLDKATQMP